MTVRFFANVAVAALMPILSGCTDSTGDDSTPSGTPSETTAIVARQDLTSSVSLDAATEPTPQYVVLAPAAGVFLPDRSVSGAVPAGTRLGTAGGTPVLTPVAGTLESFLVASGTLIQRNVPVALMRLGGFALTARVPGALAYRFYTTPGKGRALIHNGPGPFDCVVLYGVPANLSAPVRQGTPEGPSVLCAIPDEIEVFSGLTGQLALLTGHRQKVLTLPVSAVSGQAAIGQVFLLRADGSRVTVEVKLGLTDGVRVEITEGLREGDVVALPGPSLRRVP